MLTSLQPALIVTRREVRDQFRDWRIVFPIVGLTIFFPFLMNFTARAMLDYVQRYGANIIGERLVPFLLMIVGFFPISVSLVIALETFVGEKERGSIEPLLNTPLKDWQLYLGKLLSATVPPLISSFLGMGVYLAGLYIRHISLPAPGVLAQIFSLTVVQAVMMVSGAVVISTQATSVRAANLLASFIVIPAALLIQGESAVLFLGDFNTLWWVVGGVVVLTVLLVRVGVAHFRREELLGREIDVLKLSWGWRTFAAAFVDGARSPGEWYRSSLPRAIARVRIPAAMMFALALAGIWVGVGQSARFPFPAQIEQFASLGDRLDRLVQIWPAFSVQPLLAIWWQNVRALLISLVLGALSFGVLGALPVMATMGLVGYFMGNLAAGGVSPWLFLAGLVLPHGLVEMPAAVLAGAAVLRLGAVLVTPTPGRTIGEVWLAALADWAKLMAGVVMPLLLAAAAIEVWITPRIAILMLR